MATRSRRPKLLVIVGPTASGKSDLAIQIAKQFKGEIIAADSRTIYKGMDIGTAKPSRSDQSAVPHWGLDLVEPGQRFSAFQFQAYARDKIAEISQRGNMPILVGGSGLYIDSVVFGYNFRSGLGNNPLNPRHRPTHSYIRDTSLAPDILLVGLDPSADELRSRINRRAEEMFVNGVINETPKLVKKHGRQKLEKSAGIVYKICLNLIDGKITEEEALNLFRTADWQYARRQRTWFKRNPHIHWFSNKEAAFEFTREQLSK